MPLNRTENINTKRVCYVCDEEFDPNVMDAESQLAKAALGQRAFDELCNVCAGGFVDTISQEEKN